MLINLFLVNVPILYPLKTPENLRFSGVFRKYKMETSTRNGLNHFQGFPTISNKLKVEKSIVIIYLNLFTKTLQWRNGTLSNT